PMIWKKDDYLGDKGGYLRYYKSPQVPQDKYFNMIDILKFSISDNSSDKIGMGAEGLQNYYPTKNFYLPGMAAGELVRNGLVRATDTAGITNEMKFTFTKDLAYKPNLAMLNIIAGVAQEGWKRPIYFGDVISGDNFEGMADYVKLEGIVYRLVPYKSKAQSAMQDIGSVDVDKSKELFMNKYIWGNAHRNDVFFDSKSKLAFLSYRLSAGRIADALAAAGRNQEAVALLDHVIKNISEESYYYDATTYYLAVAYYHAGAADKGRQLAMKIAQNAEDDCNYIMSLNDEKRGELQPDINQDISIINALRHTATSAGDSVGGAQLSAKYDALTKSQQGASL
ncbi:MAG: rane protein, partial [Flavipsychrobacter sp.]|nr:rane protein [Flavipsychrobacter sp.]